MMALALLSASWTVATLAATDASSVVLAASVRRTFSSCSFWRSSRAIWSAKTSPRSAWAFAKAASASARFFCCLSRRRLRSAMRAAWSLLSLSSFSILLRRLSLAYWASASRRDSRFFITASSAFWRTSCSSSSAEDCFASRLTNKLSFLPPPPPPPPPPRGGEASKEVAEGLDTGLEEGEEGE